MDFLSPLQLDELFEDDTIDATLATELLLHHHAEDNNKEEDEGEGGETTTTTTSAARKAGSEGRRNGDHSSSDPERKKKKSGGGTNQKTSSSSALVMAVPSFSSEANVLQKAKENIELVCDQFVESFLRQSNAIAALHYQLNECDGNLRRIENTLADYVARLRVVTSEIGDLRERARRVAVSLANHRNVEDSLSAVLTKLIVPADVVRVILNSDSENLGPQFALASRSFLQILQYRKVKFTSTSGSDNIRSWKIFLELSEVLGQLAVFTCNKIRFFLLGKIDVLAKPHTNVPIQQRNVLRQLRPFMEFLRYAPLFLHTPQAPTRRGAAPLRPSPYVEMTAAIYQHVRTHYVYLLSRIYRDKMASYIRSCLELEESPNTASASATQSSSSSSSSYFSLMSSVSPARSSNSAAPPMMRLDSPIVQGKNSNPAAAAAAEDWCRYAKRGAILTQLQAPPIVPHVSKAAKRRHTREETFRSINSLLSDIVTSEYLFSLEFFVGDTTVYEQVFQGTVQLVIDYISEDLLGSVYEQPRSGSQQQQQQQQATASTSPGKTTTRIQGYKNKDVVGILVLIRMCHLFKIQMRYVRRIPVLDGYYSSILLLFWPAFKEAFDQQFKALQRMTGKKIASYWTAANYQTLSQKMSHIHPVIQRYAEMSSSLMVLGRPIPLEKKEESGGGGPPRVPPTHPFRVMLSLDEDYAESENWFSVLHGNLSCLRIEIDRVICLLGVSSDEEGPGVANAGEVAAGRKKSSAAEVNSYFCILHAWRRTFASLDEASEWEMMGGVRGNTSNNNAPGSPSFSVREDSIRSSVSDLEVLSSYQEDCKFFESRLETSRQALVEELLEFVFGELLQCLRMAPEPSSSRRESSAGSPHSSSAEGTPVVGSSPTQQKSPTAAAAVSLRTPVRNFPATLESTCRNFVARWQDGLQELQNEVAAYVPEPENATEILKLAFMQLLLYNARLNSLVASFLGGLPYVRSLYVSNQQLLHYMRNASGVASALEGQSTPSEDPSAYDDARYELL